MRLAVFTAVHRRHQYLRVLVRQLQKIPGESHIFFFADRATREVERECRWILEHMQERGGEEPKHVWLEPAPFPIITDRESPQIWQRSRNRYLDVMRERGIKPTHISIWDDDGILVNPLEAMGMMFDGDLVYGERLFVWGSPETYNARFRHDSVNFFRYREGDRFPEDRIVHATREAHDDEKSVRFRLTHQILDYGFMTEQDRMTVFERSKRAGKIDGYTLPLVEEPDLRTLPEPLRAQSLEFAQGFRR